MEKERVSDILLLCVAAIWGMNFVAMKFLLAHISPVNLVLFRFFIGSILLFLLLFFFGDVKIPLRDFFYLCLLGIIGITIEIHLCNECEHHYKYCSPLWWNPQQSLWI